MIFSSFLGELRALVSAKVGLEWLECGFHPNKPSTMHKERIPIMSIAMTSHIAQWHFHPTMAIISS